MDYKKLVAKVIFEALKDELTLKEIEQIMEQPKQLDFGDFAFPCFMLAKVRKKAPKVIEEEIVIELNSPLFEKVEAVNGYVNIFLDKKVVTNEVVQQVLTHESNYGDHAFGNGEVVTIDFSSPNIAKPFSMGHLRSTVIGNSISLIFEKCGYKTIRINHLGDWGTQFGKLIAAYKHWGDQDKIKKDPIKELLKLYVKFHQEISHNEQLEEEGRKWFKELEDGNEEAKELWKWFREESLKEFNRIYSMLNIKFDSYNGEAFYNDKMDFVVDLLEEKELLTESDSAQVVFLEDRNLPPCLIKKSDGATLYATRDLAAAIYRKNTYQFAQSLYVVGNEQTLNFQQLKAVLEKLDFDWAKDIHHIGFGLMRKDGKKMSTRKGEVVFLEEVLNESISLAAKNIEEKNPTLPGKKEVAEMVGIGAIVFNDLKNDRLNDIDFSLQEITRFEGETGPYVQYTNARACSILRKGKWDHSTEFLPFSTVSMTEWMIISLLMDFPTVIKHAISKYKPSIIAKYIIDLSQTFNKYYAEVKILIDDEQKVSRLQLVKAVSIVLTEGLRLLGVKAPEQM